MIDTLNSLPALTESWLAPLKREDRELYDELAESLVIVRAAERVDIALPAGLSEALSEVELRGKEIGAFRFAPISGETAADQIAAYDRLLRQDYAVEGDIVFVGEYGSGAVFVSPRGVGLLDPVPQPPRIRALAASFASFLIAQANAYDAYKRFIVKGKDEAAFRSAALECAALPALADAEVETIFDAQLVA